jgi:hypothetical protein
MHSLFPLRRPSLVADVGLFGFPWLMAEVWRFKFEPDVDGLSSAYAIMMRRNRVGGEQDRGD